MGSAGAAISRRGRVPAWVPLGLVLAGFVWVLQGLQQSADDRGVGFVDLTRYRVDRGSRYFPAAWRARLERILSQGAQLDATDAQALENLVSDLEALSFVAEVGTAEVVWPDGLVVPLRLLEPVAAIRVGDDYLPVAFDGTVLAGYAYAPHEVYGAWLPVLGPHQLVAGMKPEPEPGDVLNLPALADALAVVESMQRTLTPDEQRSLGRILVDASARLAPDGFPGGVRIELESARAVLFGRPPGSGNPGELPAHLKWQHLLNALVDLESGQGWDLLDVRWDEPVALRREDLAPAGESR
ncbi:MAG: hypothetical protein ACI8QC_002990 [Planctomycetota bacterium]|jgi:hypothetical protein